MELLDQGPSQNQLSSDQSLSNKDHRQRPADVDIEGRPAHTGTEVHRPARPSASSSSSALWEDVLQDVSIYFYGLKVTRYTDSSLQIGEIKSYFEDHEDDFKQQAIKVEHAVSLPTEPYILPGSPDQWDIDTFTPALPPRAVVDTLIASYFGADSAVRRGYPSTHVELC